MKSVRGKGRSERWTDLVKVKEQIHDPHDLSYIKILLERLEYSESIWFPCKRKALEATFAWTWLIWLRICLVPDGCIYWYFSFLHSEQPPWAVLRVSFCQKTSDHDDLETSCKRLEIVLSSYPLRRELNLDDLVQAEYPDYRAVQWKKSQVGPLAVLWFFSFENYFCRWYY